MPLRRPQENDLQCVQLLCTFTIWCDVVIVLFFSSRGKTPMECRVVESYLQQPLSPSEEKENNLLQTLQGEFVPLPCSIELDPSQCRKLVELRICVGRCRSWTMSHTHFVMKAFMVEMFTLTTYAQLCFNPQQKLLF